MGNRLDKFIMMLMIVSTIAGDDFIYLFLLEIAQEGLLQRRSQKGLLFLFTQCIARLVLCKGMLKGCLLYTSVPLMVPLAEAAGISAIAVSIPMGLCGNLMRAVSPVAAVVVIVAGTIKANPLDIVKRTSVPMIAGVVTMFVLSMIMFL